MERFWKCADCVAYPDHCHGTNQKFCQSFFPKTEKLDDYMWILIVDLRNLITYVEKYAKETKNYILERLIDRLKNDSKIDL